MHYSIVENQWEKKNKSQMLEKKTHTKQNNKKHTREVLPLTFLFLALSLTWPWISHDKIRHKYAHLLMGFYWLLERRDLLLCIPSLYRVGLYSDYTIRIFKIHFFLNPQNWCIPHLKIFPLKSASHLYILHWHCIWYIRVHFVNNALQRQY